VATPCTGGVTGSLTMMGPSFTARVESLSAFEDRCIPVPPERGCRVGVGRFARPGATPDFHVGLITGLVAREPR
jgi:hypothetical protein